MLNLLINSELNIGGLFISFERLCLNVLDKGRIRVILSTHFVVILASIISQTLANCQSLGNIL